MNAKPKIVNPPFVPKNMGQWFQLLALLQTIKEGKAKDFNLQMWVFYWVQWLKSPSLFVVH